MGGALLISGGLYTDGSFAGLGFLAIADSFSDYGVLRSYASLQWPGFLCEPDSFFHFGLL